MHETILNPPPRWWNKLGVPFRGHDLEGNRYIAWGTPITGYIVLTFGVCRCARCIDLKLHKILTEKFGEDFADEAIERRVRLRQMPQDGARRL